MTIAIRIHTTHTVAKPLPRTLPLEQVELSRAEQLRESRKLMRHFALAFVSAVASLYTLAAAGLTF